MTRKRVTQIFPFLLPLRRWQRKKFFYLKMKYDADRYADKKKEILFTHRVFETSFRMMNEESGFDRQFQLNKIHNLKLAAETINGLVVMPGETFSFWQLVRYADRQVPYKDGLTLVDGKIRGTYGGGLCLLSDMLFWMFLHTPMTVTERHGHAVEAFPGTEKELPCGTDAAVSEGWLDLKAQNGTENVFQIVIHFDGQFMRGSILAKNPVMTEYNVFNPSVTYERKNGKLFRLAAVSRMEKDLAGGKTKERKLYDSRCEITYEMEDTQERVSQLPKKRIAVLFGGNSSEYTVSLQSAAAVLEHIDTERFELYPVGITREGDWYRYTGRTEEIVNDTWHRDRTKLRPVVVAQNRSAAGFLELSEEPGQRNGVRIGVDLVFPVLHGKNGEDGTVQGLFELAGIPVVGCNTLASALCMDKDRAHRLVAQSGVAVPRSVTFRLAEREEIVGKIAGKLCCPLFVKPVRAGSSIGITRVANEKELPDALENAFAFDTEIIVEEEVQGVEVGCAILGMEELFVGRVDEIELPGGFFDYREKYTPEASRIHMPARIDAETERRIQETACVIYRTLGCSGFARVDMFYTPQGDIVFNEVNTIPGFTGHSRYPDMMKGAGLSFSRMLEKLFALYDNAPESSGTGYREAKEKEEG